MTLSELFTNIANAIRGKDGTTATITPTDFASRISAIKTGVDTSDATATASDIANGVTAYVNGEKVTGNVATFKLDPCHIADSIRQSDPYIVMTKSNNPNQLYRAGTGISVITDKSNFGDATAADVANGKTFTSSAGLKVTGNVTTTSTGFKFSTPTLTKNVTNLDIKQRFSSDYLFRNGSYVTLATSLSNFGDATAADVASGKTFTSSAGLKVTGTGSIGGTIDTSQYTLLSKSGYSATMIDYVDDNGHYTPGIKISASELSGKTIYGLHLGVGVYDSDSGGNYIQYLSYWNPTATDGAEQIISFYADCSNGRVGTNSDILIPYGRSDAGVNVVSYSNGYISIAFEPKSGSASPCYADTYSLENYVLRVWYK